MQLWIGKACIWLCLVALVLGGADAAHAVNFDSMLAVPLPEDNADLDRWARYHAAKEAAAEKMVEQWSAQRQAEIDALVKRGATAQQASDAIAERIFLAKLAISTGDFQTDISPKLDVLQRKLPILSAVVNLGHKRFSEFAGRYELTVPNEFYGCLCNSYSIMGTSIGYHPEPTDDCKKNTAPCKGGNWGCVSYDLPSGPGVWSRCAASLAQGLQRTFIDRIVDRVGLLQERYESDVCERLNKIMFALVADFDSGGKYSKQANRSIFGGEASTDEFLRDLIPREGTTEVVAEATIDKLKIALGVGQDAETGLGVLLTDQDMPSNTGDNPYIFLTKTPSREMTFEPTDEAGKPIREESIVGILSGTGPVKTEISAKRFLSYEMALAQRIMTAREPLEPHEVFRMAVEVTKGDLPFAMLIAHNLLKEAAYARRLGQPMVIGRVPPGFGKPLQSDVPEDQEIKEQYSRYFEGKAVYAGQDFIIRDPDLINSKLRDLRPVYDKNAEDRLGPWYHMFGILFVGSNPQLGESFASLGASIENATRQLNLGSGRDLGKEALNRCAVKLAEDMMRVLHPPAPP